MFSSIWGGIKSAASAVGNWVSSTASKIGSAISSAVGKNSQTASVANAIPNTSSNWNSPSTFGSTAYNAKSVSTGAQPATGPGSLNYGTTTIPSFATPTSRVSDVVIGPPAPTTLAAGSKVSSKASSTAGTASPYSTTSLSSVAPSNNISTTYTPGGLSSATPVALPSTPSYSNVGAINATGLNNTSQLGTVTVDQTGIKYVQPVTQEQPQNTTLEQKQKTFLERLGFAKIPEKENVFQSPEVLQQQQVVKEKQAELNNYTSQLNSVLNQQQADLLRYRDIVSKEGGTVAGFGGIEAEINREAAIKALPLQAAVATAQGNLSLAQDYLKTVTDIKKEAIDNDYNYRIQYFNAFNDYVTKEEAKELESMKQKAQYLREDQKSLVENIAKAQMLAVDNGQTELVTRLGNINTSSPTAREDYARILSSLKPSPATQKILSEIKTNTINLNTVLTPEQNKDPFIQKLISTAGGKPLSDVSIQKLDKGLIVLRQLGVLQNTIKDIPTGPIIGAFKGANPWDTNAQVIKAELNAIVPNLARGVYGEVGVLTDNDIKTYSQTLPNLRSTEDIRNAVLGITVDLIGKSIKQNLEINAANHKDVSAFVDIYTEMEATKESIFNQISGYRSNNLSNSVITPEDNSLFNSVITPNSSNQNQSSNLFGSVGIGLPSFNLFSFFK